jgi:acetylornithine aminotransferase
MQNAAEDGTYLLTELKKFDRIKEVRGRGLMIGIDLPDELSHVKKELLFKHHIFTGEAKPNVIRLLPALNLSKAHADRFLESFSKAIIAEPITA